MAVRALYDHSKLYVLERDIASGQTATEGYLAVHSGSDDELDDAGAGSNLGIGVFEDTVASGATNRKARVVLFGGAGIMKVKVGTGGATRGAKAKFAADGFTDAPTLADGDTVTPVWGIFMQSGVAGDFVGMLPAPSFQESA
jgi:hypothetical protein